MSIDTNRLTEQSNSITANIDECQPLEILRLLRQVDAQLFAGYDVHPGLFDTPALNQMHELACSIREMMQTEDELPSAVVFSGCGTSGRLACFCASEFTRQLNEYRDSHPGMYAGKCEFHYLIAGGDTALVRAVENAEDDPVLAVRDVEPFCNGKSYRRVLYVGITCGLSAPYVFAQIRHFAPFEHVQLVLLGFNVYVPQQVADLHQQGRFMLLNPAVGPEGITGSTRMKGGSATKIVLEVIFQAALRNESTVSVLRKYEEAYRRVYLESDHLKLIIEHAGASLKSAGHIYYIGEGTYGVLGFIDASECVPTYGASFDDVRGFVVGGWKNITEVDLSTMPKLQSNDTVVLLCKTAQFVRTVEDTLPAVAGHAKRFVVCVGDACNENSSSASVCITDVSDQGAREFSIKLMLNAISTGAHVLRGMTFGNRMINVRVSNSKLYYRAIRIISALGKVEEPKAEVMLQRSLYMVDQVTDEITKMPVSDHVVQACKREKVVPIALLLCTEKFTFAEAQTILNEDPIVRRVVRKYVS